MFDPKISAFFQFRRGRLDLDPNGSRRLISAQRNHPQEMK
jgi:hypothetical protein